MSIRNKLILMLAVPLAALGVVGALGFRAQSTTALDASVALEQDAIVQSLNRSVKAIGGERLALVEGGDNAADTLVERRVETDAALTESLDTAAQLELTEVQNTVQAAITDLAALRATGDPVGIGAITASLREARDSVDVDYPTQSSFALATSVDIAVDIADRQDSIWIEYIASDDVSTDLASRLQSEVGTTDLLREQIVDIAPNERASRITTTLAGQAEADLRRVGNDAISLFNRNEANLPDAPTFVTVAQSHDAWHGHAIALQNDLVGELSALSNDAQASQNLFALLASVGLLVLFGLIYVVYHSVVTPLNQLLKGAEAVASDRLPSVVAELRTMGSSDADVQLDPLPRESNDELGALVDAFNDVQLTAFDLAVEQARSRRNIAEMFVNLGRRNQKLLQRMLDVISDLEHDEQNAAKLEQLFELEHMTTRMRRNAESLLVVAGTTSPRQWAKPVPAADVVRSALAEVQDYHRIDVLGLAEAPMAGNAVADVTHLLAELLENSLQFSEPESRVSISSRWIDGNYRIVITDQGFGMTPAEMNENNALIANPPPPDQAPTRFLGLFVVGHLAKRHDIDVTLTDATIGGTDARITIPASMMTEAVPAEHELAPASDLPTRDADTQPDLDTPMDLDAHLDLDAELAKLTAGTESLSDAEIGAVESSADTDVFAAASVEAAPTTEVEARTEMPVDRVETFTGAASEARQSRPTTR